MKEYKSDFSKHEMILEKYKNILNNTHDKTKSNIKVIFLLQG